MNIVKKIVLSLFVWVMCASNHMFTMSSGAKQPTKSVMGSILFPDKYEFVSVLAKSSPGGDEAFVLATAPLAEPAMLELADLDNVVKVEAILNVNGELSYEQLITMPWYYKRQLALEKYVVLEL